MQSEFAAGREYMLRIGSSCFIGFRTVFDEVFCGFAAVSISHGNSKTNHRDIILTSLCNHLCFLHSHSQTRDLQ